MLLQDEAQTEVRHLPVHAAKLFNVQDDEELDSLVRLCTKLNGLNQRECDSQKR